MKSQNDYAEFYLPQTMLPFAFVYPNDFVRIVEQQLVNLEPWAILSGELLVKKAEGLKERYPNLLLIPFARRYDNDDVACWISKENGKVAVIHDYSNIERLFRDEYDNFWDWFRKALDDMMQFE